jgi:hypothetical protein
VTAVLDPVDDRVTEDLAVQAVHQAQAILGLLRPPPLTLPPKAVRSEPPPKVVLGSGSAATPALCRNFRPVAVPRLSGGAERL